MQRRKRQKGLPLAALHAHPPLSITGPTRIIPLSTPAHKPTDARGSPPRLQVGGVQTRTRRTAAKVFSMSVGLIGYKVGMTQVFTPEGKAEPVTVLELGPCPILQIRYPSATGEKGGDHPQGRVHRRPTRVQEQDPQGGHPPRAGARRREPEVEAEGRPHEGRREAPAEGRLRAAEARPRVPPRPAPARSSSPHRSRHQGRPPRAPPSRSSGTARRWRTTCPRWSRTTKTSP